ncbi:hypothetical protein Tco_0840863 [Tanacetum coccineum]|uniref:Gag-Pol polyprotein n=1 Tax=Tanacetum coccineum TaxID=301880 RepID=A0ABQ5AVU3_9ASTR
MQQPLPNPEDITDPTTAMNMALVLMAKAFKLNYSTPTNNNQRISSNPRNRQIAQPGMNMGQDRQMRMVGANGGNQFRQYAGQNVGYQNGYNAVQNVGNQVVQDAVQNQGVQNVGNQNGQIVVPGITNQNPNGNGNVVAARAEGNATGNNEAGIQLQAEEFDLMATAADLDEIEEVNAYCILMANLQQASTSGTQTDNAPVYDSDGSARGECMNPRKKNQSAKFQKVANKETKAQNRRDLPRNTPLDRVEVLGMIEKRSKVRKGIVPTEMELVLEQTQQGASHEVSVSTEGVEE